VSKYPIVKGGKPKEVLESEKCSFLHSCGKERAGKDTHLGGWGFFAVGGGVAPLWYRRTGKKSRPPRGSGAPHVGGTGEKEGRSRRAMLEKKAPCRIRSSDGNSSGDKTTKAGRGERERKDLAKKKGKNSPRKLRSTHFSCSGETHSSSHPKKEWKAKGFPFGGV